jgi:hypothetical protein
MKLSKKYLLAIALLLGTAFVVLPHNAAALTTAQEKDCFNTWVGSYWRAGSSVTPPAGTFNKTITKKQANTFTSSKCNQDNGGNCWFGIPTANEQNYAGEQIHCTGSDGNDYVDGKYNRGGTSVPTGSTTSTSAKDVKLDFATKAGDVCGSGDNTVKTSINIGCKGKGSAAVDMLFAIIRFLSNGVGLVIIGSIIYGGIQYTMSRGDPQATKLAIDRIRNSVFALFLFMFAYALLNYLIPAGFLQ